MSDLQAEIRRLATSIYELMGSSESSWFSWGKVSRHQTGSDDAAAILSCLAKLPEWRHLFAMTEYKVKLSEEGLEFVRSSGKAQKSLPETIADSVISYARGLRPIFVDIVSVSVIAKVEHKFVHAFVVELSDEILPTETPVKVICRNGNPVTGKLVGQEPDGDILYVACDTDITEAQEPHKLLIDRAYLLTQLAEQLQALRAVPERLSAMLDRAPRSVIADADSMKVADQLANLAAPWTHFLWGPPGSGKTFGLGHLVARLLIRNPAESVLIVAPSNRAVDVAINHVRNRLYASSLQQLLVDRRILRFGYPRKAEVLEATELLGPKNLDELTKRVDRVSREITAAERENRKQSELATLRANLLAAQEAVKDAVKEHVAQCSVVATTTTLAYMPRSPVAARMWDTVIVDEVTMVSPAICAYLASRAKKRFLLAGDPCQLGPVFESRNVVDGNTHIWLKNDVFVTSGISSGQLNPEAIRADDGRLARISAQRRCATDIWNHVRHLYPEVANATIPGRLKTIANLFPAPGASIALVDMSTSRHKCEQMRGSWQNVGSARTAMQVAATIASQAPSGCRIAIICPYRAQVKMLRQWIREEQKSDQKLFRNAVVEAGTVHQFQGSEADAVIFDLVDGPGRKRLGALLRGDTGIRLVNVAISRAKGKLVVIADRDWCRGADVADHNGLLHKLVFGGVAMKTVSPAELQQFEMVHLKSA